MTTPNTAASPLATPALVLGIVAAALGVFSPLPGIGIMASALGMLVAIAAVVVGHIAISKTTDRKPRIGLALGYVGLALTVGMLVVRFVAASL